MKKISDGEENEMYKLLSDSLFSFCESKPKNSIEYLAKTLLSVANEDSESINKILNMKTEKGDKGYLINEERLGNKNRTFSQDYTIIKKLSFGISGDVFLAEEKKNNEIKRAVKIIRKKHYKSNEISDTQITLLKSLENPYIVRIYDIYSEKENLIIVQEYIEEGNLSQFILQNKHKLNESICKKIIYQILRALNYLHENKIVHCDIRPENILISKIEPEIVIKLNDFATAKFYRKNKAVQELTGSPHFTSPEMITGDYDDKSDVWSIGILTYFLLSGKLPFNGKNYEILFQVIYILNKIIHNKIEFLPQHSNESQTFMIKLLNRDVRNRPDAKMAMDEKWLVNDSKDQISEQQFMKSLENMVEFVNTNALKRTVFSYILSRKIYEDDNIELMKIFEEADKDKNGLLDEKELFDLYGKYFPGTVEDEWKQIKLLMKSIDLNDSGMISYGEFLIVSNKIHKNMNIVKMKEIFDFFDTNHDNFIDPDDLKRIFNDSSTQLTKYLNMIEEYDKNSDKKLSFQEFVEMITKYF